MRKAFLPVFSFLVVIFLLFGILDVPRAGAQALGKTRPARRHDALRQRLKIVPRPQQSTPAPALVASPFIFNDKQGLDGAGPPFVIPVTNTSPTLSVQVSAVTASNDSFTVTTTCTTVAPGGSCTITLNAVVADFCSDQAGTITLTDNDPGGSLVLDADVFGDDGGFNVNNLLSSGIDANALATKLVGTGVTISNVKYTGAAVAAGTFASDNNVIGFSNGIVLSTGNIRNVIGPNCSSGITSENGTAGDTDLSNLIGQSTLDAAVLEFDFIPTSPTIRFQYVFASDEYEDFVFDFNDVFAFFVNGKNVALIPQTNTLVSINNVNNGNNGLDALHPEYALIPPVNPNFYVNNDIDVIPTPPVDTEMDGMTVVLTASAQVNPGVTNHIKLAIADALDEQLDSNVFIKAGSLSSSIVSLSPTGLAFGNVNQGSQSAPQTVTLTNVGTGTLTGVTIAPDSNNFTVSNNTCGTTVAAGANCTLSVEFSPQSGGVIQGALSFTDSAGDSPQPVSLAGTGVSGPFVTFSPARVAFPPEATGVTSPPQTVTITNTGTSALTVGSLSIANINLDGAFQITQSNCVSASIPVSGTCTAQITWMNSGSSPESDQLIVKDNAQNGQQTLALVGGVTASTINVTPSTPLAFGNQAVNTTSAPQVVTITNTGTAVVTVPSIIAPAGFAETDNCVSSGGVAPAGSCTINVTFTPTSVGPFSGSLMITDSAQGSPHSVMLTGTGTAAAPTLVSIAVTPAMATIGVNATQQFTATGTFSDNSTKDVTTQSTWTSSAPATATVGAATGLATGVAAGGPVTITATDGTIKGTAQLTVTSGPTLKSIAVTPSTANIGVNGMQPFTATGTFSDNSTKDVTTQSTWKSSNTEVATEARGRGLRRVLEWAVP